MAGRSAFCRFIFKCFMMASFLLFILQLRNPAVKNCVVYNRPRTFLNDSDESKGYVFNTPEPKPFFSYMNLSRYFGQDVSEINSTFPEDIYYRRQKEKVNSWTFPIAYDLKDLCAENPAVVFLVFSAPRNTKFRDDIRSTWGGQLKVMEDVQMAFVTGSPRDNETQHALREEAEMQSDVIIFDFVAHYENLTIKSMTTLKWFYKNCAESRFLVKADDDMTFNVRSVITNLQSYVNHTKPLVIGDNMVNREVMRTSRWHLPRSQFPFDKFLPYCVGPAYAMTSDAVGRIVTTSEYVPLVRLEDVYVTGIVRRIAGVQIRSDSAWECGLNFANNGTLEALKSGERNGIHGWMEKRREIYAKIVAK